MQQQILFKNYALLVPTAVHQGTGGQSEFLACVAVFVTKRPDDLSQKFGNAKLAHTKIKKI
jgi:hypothetical protein